MEGNGIVDTGIYVPPEFWDICSYALKADLLGAYEAHRILSTRKAIASLRANERIRRTLDAMTSETEIPPQDQDSKRSTNQELISHPPSNILCSDCVWRTARALLDERREVEATSRAFPLVTEEAFLLKISGVSVGPMITKWRADGYNQGKVAELLARFEGVSTQYTDGRRPAVPPPPAPLTAEELVAMAGEEPCREPPVLSEHRMDQVKEAFALFDQDLDGYIAYDCLKTALRFLGLEHDTGGGECSNKSRKISYWNFEWLVRSIDHNHNSNDVEDESLREYVRIFRTIDKENKGICKSHLLKILSNLGERAPSDELEAMIKVADTDNDGRISLVDFVKLMIKIQEVKKEINEENHLEEELADLSDQLEAKLAHCQKRELTASSRTRLKFGELVARVQEHIKLRTGNEEGLVVNSLYWMECDGILICKRNPLIEEEDLDKNEQDEILVQGRLYAWQVMPFKEEWQDGKDPKDNVVYQEKMNFREFLETVVWPRLTPEERKALQDSPQVEFYDEEQRKAYLISATNQEGKILDARGNLLESGLQMFVLGIDNSLYMGKKIKGVRHHTSFLAAADVSSAGMLVIDKQGAIEAIIARSGHYKPREIDMLKVVKKLLDIGANLKGVVIQYQPRLETPAEDLTKLESLAALHKVNCWKELRRFHLQAKHNGPKVEE